MPRDRDGRAWGPPPATVSVVLVTWNSRSYLPDCLAALYAQRHPPFEVLSIDNGSTDGTVEWLHREHPEIRVLENARNEGFARANNQGILASSGKYVLLLNTDVTLEPDFLSVLVSQMEADSGLGWASGKLLRPLRDTDRGRPCIDSTGERFYVTRRMVNRGEGEPDRGQYDRRQEVFGVSAAAAVYRRAMLEDIREGEQFLDSDFFSYLEDSDLNWRARIRCWRCLYDPAAVGWHVRQHATSRDVSLERHAYANRYLSIVKNETAVNLLLAAPHLLAYELFRLAKILLWRRDLLGAYRIALGRLPAALRKRREIQRRRGATSRTIRRWTEPERYFAELFTRTGLLRNRRAPENDAGVSVHSRGRNLPDHSQPREKELVAATHPGRDTEPPARHP